MINIVFPIDTVFKDPQFGFQIEHKGDAKILILTNDDLTQEHRQAYKNGTLTIEQVEFHHFNVERRLHLQQHYVLFASPDGKLKALKFRNKIYQ